MIGVLIAVGLLTAEPSEREPDQWLCAGSASTSAGSSVDVHFYVEADGDVISHYTAWDPPVSGRKAYVRRRSADMPSLSISYDKADGSGIGSPTSIDVSAFSVRSLRWLDETSVTMTVPGGPAQTGRFLVSGNHPPYRSASIAANGDIDLLTAVDNASAISTDLRNLKGKLIGRISYNVSAKDERDRLYRQAWSDAQQALRDRSKCQKLPTASRNDLSIAVP